MSKALNMTIKKKHSSAPPGKTPRYKTGSGITGEAGGGVSTESSGGPTKGDEFNSNVWQEE